MIRGRFCYLLLLAAGSYFIMLYNFQGLRFLFGCILCIPAVSFLFLIPVKLFCRIRLEGEQGGVVFSLPVDSIEGLAGAEPLE